MLFNRKSGFIISVLLSLSFSLIAQESQLNQPVSVNFNNLLVDSALQVLGKKVHLDLTYNSKFLLSKRLIKASFDAVPLSIILDSLFQNPLLSYQIVQSQLVVLPKLETEVASEDIPPSFISLSGKITDEGNKRSLPFSSISVLHRGIGVISNKEGLFIIKIPRYLQNDTLLISHLGYFQKKLPIALLKPFNRYSLNEKVVSLPEILIRNTSAQALVEKALSKISTNYFVVPFSLRAFYRESVSRNKKYMSYTEALLDIYKRPLRPTLYHDQVKVIKNRKFTDINSRDTVMFKLKGGLDAILQLDVIRNRPDFMRLSRMKAYQFAVDNMTVIDGQLVYVISFEPRSEQMLPAFEGDLYIDATTLAILQVRFSYARNSLKKMKTQFVIKSSRHFKSAPTRVSYQVSYQEFKGKYYIQHIYGNISLKVKRKRQWLNSKYDVSFEMMSTDIDCAHPLRFPSGEKANTNRIFSDFIPGYDISYWKNANIMLPEANINKVLGGLKEEDLKIEKK